ncbi:unnamed protein product [Ceutorhynchus assimilis]|uniref:beta-N-acetylhexosaminidase n=1 Tax=Ceutorhynchus assimilis TaxID=467358 RepID=A0A9N9N0X0_9CUCU|nr:unnamed protein product [Ceutorhynchus assimilis]
MKLKPNTKIISAFLMLFILTLSIIYYIVSFNHKTPIKTPLKKHYITTNRTFVPLPERIVHLDLKGAPPKIPYYSQLFPLLKTLGATGVLIEYEDMFPYKGQIPQNISALNSYTLDNIKTINTLALKHKLKIIPFIQTLGHLDFILKLKNYKEYREDWNIPSDICPSFNKTYKLLEEIITQIIEAHPNSDTIHIGCDEVPHLGHCQRCLNRQLTKNQLFVHHIQSVVNIIKRIKPSLKILAWDDHFRSLSKNEFELNSIIKPVVWWYGKDVYDELGPSLWNVYSNVFEGVWVASAFKGTSGSNKYISEVNHYLQNHKSWLTVIEEYRQRLRFEGIILTGWQRYDHFAVLCELLPVGIPALAMSLRLLQGFKDSALGPPLEVAKLLQCEQPYGLIGTAFGSPKCKFPGADILEQVIFFHQLKQEFEEINEDSRVKGWLSQYNRKYQFSSPQQVKAVLMPLDKIKADLEFVKGKLQSAMLEVYDYYTVDEWFETYLVDFEEDVLSMWKAKQMLLERNDWPQKPINKYIINK